ncbi:MAG: viroplasmin family protein [Sarcina sp.]
MGKKVYAIKEGFDAKKNIKIENKIVNTWNECLSYVKGVKGAKYKSFESLEAANEYLEDTNRLLKKGIDEYPNDCLHIYVDGSFNVSTSRYAYGLVALKDDMIVYVDSGSPIDTSKVNIRQIAGELEATEKAIEYAVEAGEKKVVVFHDYEGIFHHATGSWERKDSSSAAYYEKMQRFLNSGIEIIFVKVDSHSGDLYNEIADELCKRELDIDSDRTLDKWLKKNILKVANQKIKDLLKNLVSNPENLMICEEKNCEINKNEVVDINKKIFERITNLNEDQKEKVLCFIENNF